MTKQLQRECDDINIMNGSKEFAYLYPSRDFTFRQMETASKEYEQIRIGILSRILNEECPICFCSAEALLQYTIPPEELRNRTFFIRLNQSYKLDDLIEKLVRAGYTRRPQVEGIAQFSVRGVFWIFFLPIAMPQYGWNFGVMKWICSLILI